MKENRSKGKFVPLNIMSDLGEASYEDALVKYESVFISPPSFLIVTQEDYPIAKHVANRYHVYGYPLQVSVSPALPWSAWLLGGRQGVLYSEGA